jgi:hypothetical protein
VTIFLGLRPIRSDNSNVVLEGYRTSKDLG